VTGLGSVRIGEEHLGEQLAVPFAEDGRLEGDHLAHERFRGPAILGLAWGDPADRDPPDARNVRSGHLPDAIASPEAAGLPPRSRRFFGGTPAEWRTSRGTSGGCTPFVGLEIVGALPRS
jgi:hypothetical protein